MLTVALRFRDFDDRGSTIAEHKKVVETTGGVWWGWWKKATERYPKDLVEALCEAIHSAPVMVALFDKSTDKFYSAKAARCVRGEEKNRSPEPRQTPKYYAGESLPLWLYFEEITEITQTDFESKFGAVPKSPEQTLFKSYGRKITDNDEFIEYYSDKIDKVRILHISDLHLGDDYGFSTEKKPGSMPLLERLAGDAGNFINSPSLIVFSGDITTKANIEVLRRDGLTFLKGLRDVFKMPEERIIIVPGNHDFPLSEHKPTDYSHEIEFSNLLKDFYGDKRSIIGMHSFEAKDGLSVQFLTMNSVRLRQKSESNLGYVEWGLYRDRLATHAKDTDVRVGVLHHHLVPVPGEEELDTAYPYASVSATMDAGSVVEGLQANGFDMVLHGHQHVPGITQLTRAVRDPATRTLQTPAALPVVSAGSVGSSRLAGYMPSNSYNVIEFGREEDGGLRAGIKASSYTKYVNPTEVWFSHSKRLEG